MQTRKFTPWGPFAFILPEKILFTPRGLYKPLWKNPGYGEIKEKERITRILQHQETTYSRDQQKNTRVGRKIQMISLYLLLITFFYQWDPSTATLMEEVREQQEGLC